MTGTEYISKTALKEAIEKASHTKFDWSEEIDRDDLFKVIDEIPPADVTEITKCENCAYYHPEKGGWCERHDFEFDVGDFCCHGTPRGGR